MRWYVPEARVVKSLRVHHLTSHLSSENDYFIQWRITALFIHLVLSRCAEAGVTPLSAQGEVDLGRALSDAEIEVGVYLTDDEMMMLDEKERDKLIERKLRRRRYAYSVFIRLTSGGIFN